MGTEKAVSGRKGHGAVQAISRIRLGQGKKNEGEVPQYYVEGNHEAIIPPAQFDRVQKEMQGRFGDTDRHGCVSIFSSKIRCGDCGYFYGSKVWHSNDKYRKVIWQCNHKYDDGKNCSTPHLDEDTIKALYLTALRILARRDHRNL